MVVASPAMTGKHYRSATAGRQRGKAQWCADSPPEGCRSAFFRRRRQAAQGVIGAAALLLGNGEGLGLSFLGAAGAGLLAREVGAARVERRLGLLERRAGLFEIA